MPIGADLNIGSKGGGRLFRRYLLPKGKDAGSKICINPDYLWTGRGPEMHNDFNRLAWKSKQGLVLAAGGSLPGCNSAT